MTALQAVFQGAMTAYSLIPTEPVAALDAFRALRAQARSALDAYHGPPPLDAPEIRALVDPSLVDMLVGLGLCATTQCAWDEARDALEDALRRMPPPADPASQMGRAFALNSLGDSLVGLRRIAESEDRFLEASNLFLAAGNPTGAVQALAKRADAARERHDASAFLQGRRQAVALARQHGLHDLAQALLSRDAQLAPMLVDPGELDPPPDDRVPPRALDALLADAATESARGATETAKLLLREALADSALAEDPPRHVKAYLDLAALCLSFPENEKPRRKTARLMEGLAAARQAETLAQGAILGKELAALARRTRVQLLFQSNDPCEQEESAREIEALCLADAPEEATAVLVERAWHRARQGDPEAALADVSRARELAPNLAWKRIVDLAQIGILTRWDGHADEALTLSLAALGPGGSFDVAHAEAEHDVTRWLAQLSSLETLQGNLAVLLAKAGRVREAFDAVEQGKARRLRAMLATRDDLGPSKPVSLEALRDALREDRSVMALFWVGADAIFVLVVDPWDAQPYSQVIPHGSRELRRLIQADALAAWSAAQVDALSALLVPALRQAVEHCQQQGATLTLVPDSELFAAPFAALWWDEAHDLTLAHQCAIAHAPSATLWMSLRELRAAAGPRRPLVAVTGSTQDASGRLIAFESQARAVATLLGTVNLLVDPEKDCFLAAAREATVVHLESHGRIDTAAPADASSYLEFPGGTRLTATEVYDGLKGGAPTELVFLNACLSGRFVVRLQSEPTGFWETFLRTGTVAVVATLLEVDPTAAAPLAQAFYQHWLQNPDAPAEALRQAQLSIRNQRRDPADWAAHLLIGHGGTGRPS
ncbi:MAG: CHAT domain-containing protein [Isosphaeraceae bacterium]